MQIHSIELKNFRCFTHKIVKFDSNLVIIEGDNGSGKTSLLEAMHYGCYLRSFRTYNPRYMLAHGQESFSIKLHVDEGDLLPADHEIQIGFSGKRRSVKLNQHSICSYKELMESYRAITITEDDLGLITGGPEVRRTFIDTALILGNPLFTKTLADLKRIIDQRTSLIAQKSSNHEVFKLWTQQLWEKSCSIQQERLALLTKIEGQAQKLIQEMFNGAYTLNIYYRPKMDLKGDSFEEWFAAHPSLYEHEITMGRSLFGAHLDDFVIKFQDNHSKVYASRGQQKLIVMLIKMAQVHEIALIKGPAVLLLDDFLTDFDRKRAELCLKVLVSLHGQIILTTPIASDWLSGMIETLGGQRIVLSE
ncbi:MAG TPA: DNA replication and repair protein RecF [Candidatus Dependentiae bacterium]|nr:DNA replication and repair protein RecF [Candidatus Dependentiae bacterium]